MIERHFILDGIDPVGFYGAGNVHLQMLKRLHPKLRIVARDNVIKALGDEDELERFNKIPMSERERELILSLNIKRLLNL